MIILPLLVPRIEWFIIQWIACQSQVSGKYQKYIENTHFDTVFFFSILVQFHSDINEFLILYRRYIVIISSSLINEVSYVNLMYSNSRHHFRTHFRTAHQSDFLMTLKIPKVCKLFGVESLKRLSKWVSGQTLVESLKKF